MMKKTNKAKASSLKLVTAIDLPDERVFSSGDNYFQALLKDIQKAKHSVDLETYIFTRDELGKRVAQALADAAERGVKVRISVDGAGSPMWSTSFAKMLETAGAKTRVFHPFPWALWSFSRSLIKLPFLLKWVYLLLKMNSRNHRKICIIDNEIAYIGSFNISQTHMPVEADGEGWRDLAVRLSKTDLSPLKRAFENAWEHHSVKERIRDTFRHVRQDPNIRLNDTWFRRRIFYKHLLKRISQCQNRIWITNAYFVPDNFLLKKLREKAKEGVDVRVVLPKKSDVFLLPWASSTFYYSLLKAGVKIYEYLPSILHAKSLILDDWMLIGSSNLNHRSLLHDLEADIKVQTDSAKMILEQTFIEDFQNSRKLSLKSFRTHRPFLQRFMGRLALYMKFWI